MYHRLLARQLQRLMGNDFLPDERWNSFLQLISNYYYEVDLERGLLENALEVNSEELTSANAQLRAKAEHEKALLQSFMNSIPDLFFAKSMDGVYMACNQMFERTMGVTEKEIIGKTDAQLLNADRILSASSIEKRVLGTNQQIVVEEWITHSDGSKHCLEMLRAPYYGVDGKPLGLIGIGRDITDRRKLEEQIRLSALVYQHTAEGMLVTDPSYQIIDINPACARMTGYELAEVRGKSPEEMFNSGRQNSEFYELMRETVLQTGSWSGEVWACRKNREIFAKSMVVNSILGDDGKVNGFVMLFSDITEKKQANEKILLQANYDSLTDLPNRSLFRERLKHEIFQAERARSSVALLMIDLDHFKEINDTLGHLVGDVLLKEAALRISECTRKSDTVARLGGDEFTVILSRMTDPKHVEIVAQKIIARLAEPFQLGDSVVYVSASVGITVYPQDALEAEELLKSADQAMYVAKRQGRNRFSYFTQGLQTAAQEKSRLSSDLRTAISENQFYLNYQPILDLDTGHIQMAEALLRWDHPTRGIVMPGEFIPLAEETGLIMPIADWVFREAAKWAGRWNDLVPGGFQVCINASPVQFRAEGVAFQKTWIEYLKDNAIPGKCIVIEITEGVLFDADTDALEILQNFHNADIKVAIDDFGTGYSAYGSFAKFPIIKYLKIDKSFIHVRSNTALCEGIIMMAHKLGLQVIAECVEEQLQSEMLEKAGCNFVQGYLYSRPILAEQLDAILRHGAMSR